jgi:hypothetical protein
MLVVCYVDRRSYLETGALLTYCFALMELQKTQGDLTAEQWSILDQYLTRLKSIDSCRREYYADYLTRIKAIQSMDWPTLIARQIVTVKILEKCLDGVELDLRSLDESALSCLASYPLINLMVRPEPFSAPSHEP